jgi:hypothetical protein
VRDDDALDPELARLYAIDRAAPLPDGAPARVLAAVLAGTVASSTGGGAAAAAAAGVARRTVVAIALASAVAGAGIAVLGVRALSPTPAVVSPVLSSPRDAGPDVALLPDAPIVPVPDASAVDGTAPPYGGAAAGAQVPAVEAGARVPATQAPPRAESDSRESLLIDRARAALRRGLVDDALATLMQHERMYPHGALAEERSVLTIEAYVAQGNATLARRRIEAYRRDLGSGFLRARVDRAEAELPPPRE